MLRNSPHLPDPATNNSTSPATLSIKDSLGAALTKQGKSLEATTLLQDVLATRKSLGQTPDSEGMLCTMNNLAAALQHQGDFVTAETLFRSVLEAETRSAEVSISDLGVSMQNLAVLLAHHNPDQNENSAGLCEATELLQRALQISRQQSSTWTIQSLQIRAEQGKVLLRQKKFTKAEKIAREVLAQRRVLLPADHPEISMAMSGLSDVLKRVGKVEEAEELLREAHSFGEVHPEDTEAFMDGDGKAAMEKGDFQAAERIFRGALVANMG